MSPEKRKVQLIWGGALLVAGFGVFYRITQVMPKIETIDYFKSSIPFIRICFYLLGALLIYGGGRKLFTYYPKQGDE